MLTEAQSEGLCELLDSVRGTEESDNRSRIAALKGVAAQMLAAELTERQRTVLLLLYGERLTQREIAKKLGIRETAVSNLKKRALLKLRRLAKYIV